MKAGYRAYGVTTFIRDLTTKEVYAEIEGDFNLPPRGKVSTTRGNFYYLHEREEVELDLVNREIVKDVYIVIRDESKEEPLVLDLDDRGPPPSR